MNKAITFIEVGGFYGMTTDFVLEDQLKWDILILEPTPFLFKKLLEKYKDEPRVQIFEAALWNKNEVKIFHVSGHSGASSLCGNKANLGEYEAIDVQCLRATDQIQSLDTNIVLNLNCEGAEIKIMEDLMQSGAYHNVMIFIQDHKPVMPNPELYDIMFAKMDDMGVDYLRGTYGKLHKGAIKKGINMQEFLIERKKPHWAEVFSPGVFHEPK